MSANSFSALFSLYNQKNQQSAAEEDNKEENKHMIHSDNTTSPGWTCKRCETDTIFTDYGDAPRCRSCGKVDEGWEREQKHSLVLQSQLSAAAENSISSFEEKVDRYGKKKVACDHQIARMILHLERMRNDYEKYDKKEALYRDLADKDKAIRAAEEKRLFDKFLHDVRGKIHVFTKKIQDFAFNVVIDNPRLKATHQEIVMFAANTLAEYSGICVQWDFSKGTGAIELDNYTQRNRLVWFFYRGIKARAPGGHQCHCSVCSPPYRDYDIWNQRVKLRVEVGGFDRVQSQDASITYYDGTPVECWWRCRNCAPSSYDDNDDDDFKSRDNNDGGDNNNNNGDNNNNNGDNNNSPYLIPSRYFKPPALIRDVHANNNNNNNNNNYGAPSLCYPPSSAPGDIGDDVASLPTAVYGPSVYGDSSSKADADSVYGPSVHGDSVKNPVGDGQQKTNTYDGVEYSDESVGDGQQKTNAYDGINYSDESDDDDEVASKICDLDKNKKLIML